MYRYDNFTIHFAEQKHLAKRGQRITADDVCTMPYGTVHYLLDAIKGDSHEVELSRMLNSAFKFASKEASNIMLPKNKSYDKIWQKNNREGKDKKNDCHNRLGRIC